MFFWWRREGRFPVHEVGSMSTTMMLARSHMS